MIKKILSILITLSIISCAHVAPPKPPLKKMPISPKIDEIYERGEFLHILATLPTKNSDNSPVKFYRRIILKSGIFKGKINLSEVNKSVDRTLTYEKNEFYEIFKGKNKLHFKIETKVIFPKKEKRFLFIEFINDAGRLSPPSNIVKFYTKYFVETPKILDVRVTKNFIDIKWDFDKSLDFDGFDIYRFKNKKSSKIFVKGKHFNYKDREFLYGEKYTYKIDAVKKIDNFNIYSYYSKTVSVKPIDVFPPDIPQNITYLFEGKNCKIFWDPSLDSDLKGYFIYRKIDNSPWEKINKMPIKKNIYVDKNLSFNVEVKYRITSIDLNGNESKPSKTVVIKKK